MIILTHDYVVMFDIDDTLITWQEGKPHYAHLAQLMRHHNRGQAVGMWSKGGGKWVAKAVDLLGLQNVIVIGMKKPETIYDDQLNLENALVKPQYLPFVDEGQISVFDSSYRAPT